jgi:RHS repeat-associated protein
MNGCRRSAGQLRTALLLAALALVSGQPRLWAQSCPSISLTITRTTPASNLDAANQNVGLSGQVAVMFTQQGTADGSVWKSQYLLNIYGTDGTLVWQTIGTTGSLLSGESYFDWISASMRRPYDPANPLTGASQAPIGPFSVQVELQLKPWSNPNGPWTCTYVSPTVTRLLSNLPTSEVDPSSKLSMVCGPNNPGVPTTSETDPLSGNQSWSIAATSWPFKGNSYGLTLTYSSVGMVDPNTPDLFNVAGLSEKNSHWTHSFAMWLTLPSDESQAGWAVVHRPGMALTFRKPASGNTWTPLESFDTLVASMTTVTPTVTYPCNGASVPFMPTVAKWFTLTDRDGTNYVFGSADNNVTSPVWRISECSALPVYLLSKITDRWGREIDVTWTDVLGSGTGWRVTLVGNPGGPTLTLTYSGAAGLLQNAHLSTDPVGVNALALGYNGVMDETSTPRQKLTSLTLKGPAGVATRTRTWTFAYRNPNDLMAESAAYSGTVTGDLVIAKTQPDGLTYNYVYEAVSLPRATSADYDGRFKSVSWSDSSEGPTVTRMISRAASGNSVTLTYPGGVQTQYNYSGSDLTALTELANTPAARTWTYHYTAWHNRDKIWSPLEPTTSTPLVQNVYVEDPTSGHISQVTTTVPIANGTNTMTIDTDTYFNSYNLPTQIVAHHDTDPNAFPIGLANFPHYQDQVTTFGYDEGLSPAKGNLTSITRQDDSGQNWTTLLLYDTPDGVNGPPGHITNDVGGQSGFTYDSVSGLLTSASSPLNTVVGMGSPDYLASTTQITGYEEHGLPTQVTDPLLRVTSTAYQGDSQDARYLDVTTTFATDGTSRVIQFDPMDRLAVEQDERGVQTARTYNPQGQVKTITRNSHDTDPTRRRTAVYYYNDQGDLYALDPPAGSGSRVQFDYRQYTQSGALDTLNGTYPNGLYIGRLGRVIYADGRTECFGYNAAGELIWKLKGDGTVITITRDVQHRVATVTYPTAGGGPSFTVTRLYDEFGRPKQTVDLNGTTDVVWDSLNRLAHVLVPSPQKSIDFSYQADATNHRWTTSLNVSGLGVYSFSADSKGRLFYVTNTFSQGFTTECYLDGTLRKRTWPNGVIETRTYNARGFLSQIQINQPGGGTLNQYNYKYGYNDANPSDYDGTGRIRREVDQFNQTHAFFYNDLYELVGESAAPALGTGSLVYPYDVNYTYDLNGNRTSRSQGAVTDYYGNDPADRLIWVNRGVNAAPTSGQANPYTLNYYNLNDMLHGRDRRDSNGVLQYLWFWWDGDDHLRKATTIQDPNASPFFLASYNADGIRTSKDDTRTGVLQHNDFSWSPYGLLWSSNPNTVYTPGFGHRSNGINSFYQVDWLGSTRYVTDITGSTVLAAQSYDAWGHRDAQAMGSPNWPTDLQFAGGWGYQTEWSIGASEPGLGLDYLQQRYYDPVIGRFISPDPIGFAGGLNLYRYSGDDPAMGIDPTGTMHKEPGMMGGGGAGDINGEEGGELIGLRLLQLFERVAEKIRWPWGTEPVPEEAPARPPNPWGRLGCLEHREVVKTLQQYLEDIGWKWQSGGELGERGIRLPWNGRLRFPDLVMQDGAGRTIAINVGRVTRAGIPVARELRAVADLINASVFDDVTFVPYFP